MRALFIKHACLFVLVSGLHPWPAPPYRAPSTQRSRGIYVTVLIYPAPARLRLVELGGPVSSPGQRYKLSLREADGFETLDRIEYVESGVRLSKGCYLFRRRPVFVETVSPRLVRFADPHFPFDATWSRVVRAGKVGPIAIVRLGDPPPYAHVFIPLVGAWHVSGWVPGAVSREPVFTEEGEFTGQYTEHRLITTILNEDSIDRRGIARYVAQGAAPCPGGP